LVVSCIFSFIFITFQSEIEGNIKI
jgi:hypothetical protein